MKILILLTVGYEYSRGRLRRLPHDYGHYLHARDRRLPYRMFIFNLCPSLSIEIKIFPWLLAAILNLSVLAASYLKLPSLMKPFRLCLALFRATCLVLATITFGYIFVSSLSIYLEVEPYFKFKKERISAFSSCNQPMLHF